MAFTTSSAAGVDVYNTDFSIGWGAKGNRADDIMLVQALFRIAHFELPEKDRMPAPAGMTSIDVDGKLGSGTNRFMVNWQKLMSEFGMPTLRDGIFDPYRTMGELSHIARVRYALDILQQTSMLRCRANGMDNYERLPQRTDIPPALASALSQRRTVALKYQSASAA